MRDNKQLYFLFPCKLISLIDQTYRKEIVMDKKCRKQVSSAILKRVSSRIRDSCTIKTNIDFW